MRGLHPRVSPILHATLPARRKTENLWCRADTSTILAAGRNWPSFPGFHPHAQSTLLTPICCALVTSDLSPFAGGPLLPQVELQHTYGHCRATF